MLNTFQIQMTSILKIILYILKIHSMNLHVNYEQRICMKLKILFKNK
jgi:hypothetical protein